MFELPELYEHQSETLGRLRSAISRDRCTVLQAPPGFGKTRLSKWVMGSFANRDKRDGESGFACFAVHRRALVDNASGSFNEHPQLPHGVIMSGVKPEGGQHLQVASIDTLLSWYAEDGQWQTKLTFDLIVFDECHAHLGKLRTMLAAHNRARQAAGLRDPYVLGLSATPQHEEMGQTFSSIVSGPSTQWLIDQGYLTPYRYYRATRGRTEKLRRQGDGYNTDSICEAMDGLSGDMVRDWLRLACGRATVGFFPRRSHAAEARAELRSHGIKAEYVDGETPDDERRDLFDALNRGTIDYICNVGVVERGTDIPRISCVQMCTCVGSIVRWLQMLGRGSRNHHDKSECLVIDHGNGIERHGFFEDAVDWTLTWDERPSKTHVGRLAIECPQCQAVYRGGKCRACGYEPTHKERKAQGLRFDGSELVEAKTNGRQERQPKSNEQLWVSALYMSGASGRTFKQALGIAYSSARQQGSDFKVPREFTVAGQKYRTVPYKHPDQSRRVWVLYGFTMGDYSKKANPYRIG